MSAQMNFKRHSMPHHEQLTVGNMNPYLRQVTTDACDPLIAKAAEIERELQQGVKKPFTEVIKCHWGDPQAMGQKPITFLRQVIAVCTYPELQHNANIPEDVKYRAKKILESYESISSYNSPYGLKYIQRNVAKYIERRDGGVPSHPHNIYIMGGSSISITVILKLLITGEGPRRTGVLFAIPQYPCVADTVTLLNGVQVEYTLKDEQGWALEIPELQRVLTQARTHCNPLAMYVINPHNPTGHVMSRKSIEDVIQFAAKERLFLLVDEVYQDNVFAEGCQFHSFKKVLFEMGSEYSDTVELATFHSISKGYMGECGTRGSFLEIVNLDSEVQSVFNHFIGIHLRCPLSAQIAIDVFTDPPKPGDTSYQLFNMEKEAVLRSQAENALLTETILNSEAGIHCQPIQGAFYAYPRIHIPPRALEAAKALNEEADVFYCTRLLEETGILLLAGSSLRQPPGPNYIRLILLLESGKLKEVLKTITQFHRRFTAAFS